MITKEFIKELEKARSLFEWTLSLATGPMAERRATPRFRVRARLKNSSDMVQFDPIGAVCFAQTGMTFVEDYWVEAAISIGLPVEDAREICSGQRFRGVPSMTSGNRIHTSKPFERCLLMPRASRLHLSPVHDFA